MHGHRRGITVEEERFLFQLRDEILRLRIRICVHACVRARVRACVRATDLYSVETTTRTHMHRC